MKIAYQGIAGSYSETAVQHYLRQKNLPDQAVQLQGYDNFRQIIQDLVRHELDLAMLPVENSTTGLITRTLDLFKKQALIVTAERYQEVQHTLWSVAGSSIDQLEKVYSHPEALQQCQSFFDQYPHIQPIPYIDTAQSARMVQELKDPLLGALASPRCGDLYDLMPLQQKIQTEASNTTRFFLAQPWPQGESQETVSYLEDTYRRHPKRLRWMLYVETPHEPGSLVKLLNIFNLFTCNLEGLDARPIPNQPFKYGFFIEVDVAPLEGQYDLLWRNLEYASDYLQLIACFQAQETKKGDHSWR